MTICSAIWWSYLHDCCHSIYFALPSSYHPSEIELNLPCEDTLWQAGSSADWLKVLQTTSPYGSSTSRLTGISMPQSSASLWETRSPITYIPLNPFAHFILVHAILRHLFITCAESRTPKLQGACNAGDDEMVKQEIYHLQYALHNWLQNWMNSPELPQVNDSNDEPLFVHNGKVTVICMHGFDVHSLFLSLSALPFYWLGQVSLLAYQESLAPFEQDSPNNLVAELRFRLVKQWLKHIRGFLKKGDQAPTLFWDELMKLRLRTWQQEMESDDQEGLLGFFPEH